MNQLITLLSQRRVWAGIVGVLTFAFSALGIASNLDSVVLTDMLTEVGKALGALIPALLALLSYILPKK